MGKQKYARWKELMQQMNLKQQDIARRQFLKAAALGVGMAGLESIATTLLRHRSRASAAGNKGEVVVVSWGGAYQDAQRKTLFQPFEEATGIKVIDTSQPDAAKIKAMVDSNNVEWDVVTTGLSTFIRLGEDYFDPIDYSLYSKEQLEGTLPEAQHPYAMGTIFFAVVNSYRTDVFPTGKHPKNWAEFWDTKRFPGPRTLHATNNIPSATLEAALMAAEVPPDKIYPLDVDLAFKKLDEIKPHVLKWWETGAVPGQLLTDKEVVLAMAYSARITKLAEDKVPVAVEWNQGVLYQDRWFIIKNARNRENAQKFIQFVTQAKVQADLANIYATAPTNLDAFKYIVPERAAALPTKPEHMKQMIFYNEKWWGENQAAIQERFTKWRIS
jgi:putative spermidine/putrescine transport system substrate-binding protein